MKKVLSLITTIMDGLLSIAFLLYSPFVYKAINYIESFTEGTFSNMANVNPDDVTAGYVVLGRMFMGFGGIFAILFMWIFFGVCLFAFIYFLIAALMGISAYRKGDDKSIYNDAIAKIVFNGIALVAVAVSLYRKKTIAWLLPCYLGVVVALAIWQLSISKAK